MFELLLLATAIPEELADPASVTPPATQSLRPKTEPTSWRKKPWPKKLLRKKRPAQ